MSNTIETKMIPADDVIDLTMLFRAWWRGRWVVVAAAILAAIYGAWQLHAHTPLYRAEIVVLPEGGQLNSMQLGGMSGIAGALGIGFSASTVSEPFERLVLNIGSIRVADSLNETQDFLRTIYSDQWDSHKHEWRRPDAFWFNLKQAILGWLQVGTWHEPDVETLAKYLSSKVIVEDVTDTKYKKIYFEHKDRAIAREVLALVYDSADRLVREDDLSKNAEQRSYVIDKLREATVQDVRTALITLLTEIEKKAMLLTAKGPYAARIIEPLRVGERPEKASIIFYLIIPLIAAVMAAILIITFVSIFRFESEDRVYR